MSFFSNSSNNMQSGQSFTLDVKRVGNETVVRCDGVPEIGEIKDTNERFAIQEMRRKLDDYIHQGSQSERRGLLLEGGNPDAD